MVFLHLKVQKKHKDRKTNTAQVPAVRLSWLFISFQGQRCIAKVLATLLAKEVAAFEVSSPEQICTTALLLQSWSIGSEFRCCRRYIAVKGKEGSNKWSDTGAAKRGQNGCRLGTLYCFASHLNITGPRNYQVASWFPRQERGHSQCPLAVLVSSVSKFSSYRGCLWNWNQT